MKASGLSLSIAVLAFGASTIYLAVQLSEERARSEQLAEASRALNARIAELEKAREQNRVVMNGTFGAASLGAGAPLGALPPPPPPAAKSATGSEAPETVVMNAPPMPPRGEAFQKMIRSQMRASNRQLYADVGPELGLTREETSKLIDLLTDQQVAGLGISRDVTDHAERQRLVEQAMRDNKARIAELLGTEKLKLLEEYQQSIPARQELDMLARQIEGSDAAALTADQRKRLLAALTEERSRVPVPSISADTARNDIAKLYANWQDDYETRLAAQARGILNSEQFKAFDEYQQAQKEMREQMNAMRAQSGGNSDGFFINASPGVVMGETAVITSTVTEEKPDKTP